MGEYAPQMLLDLAAAVRKVFPKAQLSGVIGDVSHTYGYHRARSKLPRSDYSVQVPEDRAGDADAASAVDITMGSTADMRTVTARLLASAKDQSDPRLNYCREFYGTLDGKTVTGWDTYYGKPATSDDSHLWHVHISFLRKYANDRTAMQAVLSVITGTSNTKDSNDMPTPQELMDADVVPAPRPPVANADYAKSGNTKWTLGYTLQQAVEEPRHIRQELAAVSGQIAGLTALVQQLVAHQGGPLTATQFTDLTKAVTAAAEAPGRELLERMANAGRALDPPTQ